MTAKVEFVTCNCGRQYLDHTSWCAMRGTQPTVAPDTGAAASSGNSVVPTPEREWTEIRNNDDGTLDEIVGYGTFHLEQMDDGFWWLGLGDSQIVHVRLFTKRKAAICAGIDDERSPPVRAAHEAVAKERERARGVAMDAYLAARSAGAGTPGGGSASEVRETHVCCAGDGWRLGEGLCCTCPSCSGRPPTTRPERQNDASLGCGDSTKVEK